MKYQQFHLTCTVLSNYCTGKNAFFTVLQPTKPHEQCKLNTSCCCSTQRVYHHPTTTVLWQGSYRQSSLNTNVNDSSTLLFNMKINKSINKDLNLNISIKKQKETDIFSNKVQLVRLSAMLTGLGDVYQSGRWQHPAWNIAVDNDVIFCRGRGGAGAFSYISC